MNILVVSCIHNDIENLMNYFDKLSLLKFDIIVSPGDFTNAIFSKGFTRLNVGQLILEELRSFKVPLLVVPGSWDKELINLFEKENISLHGKGKVINNVGFYGFGGAKTPFNLPYEPGEEEIKEGLEKAYSSVANLKIKIQVTHAPPARTKLDVISSGAHVGSETIRKFIEDKKPDVAICSHIHESKGIDEIGPTKVINTGKFSEGYCGLVSVNENEVSTKIINLI